MDICGSQQPGVALETEKERGVALATDEMRGYPDKKLQELILQGLAVLFPTANCRHDSRIINKNTKRSMLLVESSLFQPLYFYSQAKPGLCLMIRDPYADVVALLGLLDCRCVPSRWQK